MFPLSQITLRKTSKTGLPWREIMRRCAADIDRIAALGQAMEMDTIWDGKDLIAGLSRFIG